MLSPRAILGRGGRSVRNFRVRPSSSTFSPFALSRLSSSSTPSPSSTFQPGPSPPRLPPREQAEFERLQRTANTQEGFNPSATDPELSSSTPLNSTTATSTIGSTRAGEGGVEGDSALSTPLRRGAPPEFEGEVNPRTGEVGGPKNEPLRWGAQGDYSFNGRVTDF
ncbi:hypothetical protein F4810DRAFT_396288 [Camillea tinctor]|nr:hypothetical protein F4810DRAFT_396288 [Camillea tinctor]